MHKVLIASASAVALGLAAPAARAGFDAGSSNLQFGAALTHQQDTDSAIITGDLTYGYFVTQGIELGVNQSLNYNIIDDADDIWSASTIAFANYNFGGPDARIVPFVGAFGGLAYNEDDASATVGPNAGMKVFINDNTFTLVRYRYEWFIDDLENGDLDDNASDGSHIVTVGMGVKF